MPEYLIKGELMTLVGLYVTQKVFTISSGCARHIPVYVYISVKGSRVCKPCNVLAVRKYVRASMV